MSSDGYILDANVIYSNILRDVFVTMGTMGLPMFWSRQIADEFITARDRKATGGGKQARKVLDLMEVAIPDWEVVPAPSGGPPLNLPDPDDLHVVYAALALGSGTVIVTENLRDFPPDTLEGLRVSAQSPDTVLSELLDSQAGLVIDAVQAAMARLQRPPVSLPDWLDRLESAGCPNAAATLRTLLMPEG
jgi:hypothetical protein